MDTVSITIGGFTMIVNKNIVRETINFIVDKSLEGGGAPIPEPTVTAPVAETTPEKRKYKKRASAEESGPVKKCTVEDCDGKLLAKGFCSKHYWKNKDAERAGEKEKKSPETKVDVENFHKHKILSEEDFGKLAIMRNDNSSSVEIARLMNLRIEMVNKAWPYQTYAAYKAAMNI